MSSVIGTFLIFFDPIGLTVILVYFYGNFSRSQPSVHQLGAVMGVVFGLATWIAMAAPINMGNGVIIDLRNLFVGISAAFFGIRAALITLCMAIAMRLGIGGTGILPDTIGICVASLMGWAWAAFVRPRITNPVTAYLVLAPMISVHLVAVFVFPWDFALMFLGAMAPFILVSNLVGTMVFSLLIQRERSLAGHESSLRFAATTDPLTDILNRRSVVDRYETLGKTETTRRGVAMVCIDVDKFKEINDT